MVSELRPQLGCRTKGLVFIMGSKGDGKHFVGPGFAWHGLESCCCSGVSEPASKGLAPMVSELRPQLGCRTKGLVFIMGSKGDGKHFVGPGFAWHGLESCCCSGVSEPASKGLAPMVSELRPQLQCRTKGLAFIMGSKGDGKHFVGPGFAWHGLESCCCSGVSEPASKGLAPMVSELRPQLGCRTKGLVFIMGSKGDGKHFVGPGFAWHGLESCCCSGVSEPASKGLAPRVSELRPQLGCRTKGLVFIMGSQGDGKHFVGPGFAWHGLESCCCSGVSEPASKGLAPMVSELRPHLGFRTKGLVFIMGSKGDGKHFVGPGFAWHVLESCCCSGVSEPASKGLAPMVSELRPQLGCRTKGLVFIVGSKGDGKHFVGPGFAWHRILLLFGCFGTGLQRTCANGFGTTSAARVPDQRTGVYYGFQRWREAFCGTGFCLAWARILLLFGCFGTGLQRTCANGFGTTSAAIGCRTKGFCGTGFCLAWARILLLFGCFGTGLQRT